MRLRYRDAKTGRTAIRVVSGAEFLWLMLQHVLPKGFRRARNLGFLHPNCKRLIALLQVVLKWAPAPMTASVRARASIVCTCCWALMMIVKTRIRAGSLATPPLPIAMPRGALIL